MDENELEEELEHQEFLAELEKLQEQLFLSWLDRPVNVIAREHNDIMRFGDEPVLTSLIFDRMMAENESNDRNSPSENSD